jgi:hypothetical protein
MQVRLSPSLKRRRADNRRIYRPTPRTFHCKLLLAMYDASFKYNSRVSDRKCHRRASSRRVSASMSFAVPSRLFNSDIWTSIMKRTGKYWLLLVIAALLAVLSTVLTTFWDVNTASWRLWFDGIPFGLGLAAGGTGMLIVSRSIIILRSCVHSSPIPRHLSRPLPERKWQ